MTFGASTELEMQLAEFVVGRVTPVEKIRFVSSGTEAVMSAIRLARGFTGRDLILKFDGCYHGHADHLLVSAGSGLATFGQPSSAGVPEEITKNTVVLPLDDEQALTEFFSEHGDSLAAAIIEGVPANNGLLIQRPEYMQLLRELTAKHGALLILDEVITGNRLGMGGAAEHYGLVPDLLTYGKIIGGGMPVGAFGGRADIMDHLSPLGSVYQAGTLSGNPLAMVAGLTTLEKLADGIVHDELQAKTDRFISKLTQTIPTDTASVVNIASIVWIAFQSPAPSRADQIDPAGIEGYNRIHGQLLDIGLYLPPSGYEVMFVSAAHTDEMLSEAAQSIASVICDHIGN
jgi:glutamate-1-semialdehyde 2,1-aminomutase